MQIHIANNDNHGRFTNKFAMVEFESQGETAMRLETRTMFPVKADVFDTSFAVQQLKIYGITIKVSLVGTWTGNMMWNTIETLDDYALGFLRALQLSREWDCIEAWKNLFEKFNSGEVITGHDFELDEDIQPRVVNPSQLEIPYL